MVLGFEDLRAGSRYTEKRCGDDRRATLPGVKRT
jgi:hypothetical protein